MLNYIVKWVYLPGTYILYNADSTSNYRPNLVYEVHLPQGWLVPAEKSGRGGEGNPSRKLI